MREHLGIFESLKIARAVFRVCRSRMPEIYYIHAERFGVPAVCALVAVGREAWRVSHIAIECHPGVTRREP